MSDPQISPRRNLRARFRDWRGTVTRALAGPQTETLLSLSPDEVARLVKNARQS